MLYYNIVYYNTLSYTILLLLLWLHFDIIPYTIKCLLKKNTKTDSTDSTERTDTMY